MNRIAELERQKYQKAWGQEAYRAGSPGVHYLDMFGRIARPESGLRAVDIGAGSGAASVQLRDRFGLHVTGFDLTDTAWDVEDMKLATGTIWNDLRALAHPPFDFGYCCDVMEHIPTQFVALTLREILNSCARAFFSISFTPDVMGHGIGETLHLTVQPFVWWRDTFAEIGTILDARDLMGDGVFYVSR